MGRAEACEVKWMIVIWLCVNFQKAEAASSSDSENKVNKYFQLDEWNVLKQQKYIVLDWSSQFGFVR